MGGKNKTAEGSQEKESQVNLVIKQAIQTASRLFRLPMSKHNAIQTAETVPCLFLFLSPLSLRIQVSPFLHWFTLSLSVA